MPPTPAAEILSQTSRLTRRAEVLRRQAADVGPVVAQAYRRRASELDLEAWAIKARTIGAEPLAA